MSRYSLIVPTDAPLWARQMQVQFNDIFARVEADMRPPRFAKADLPTDGGTRFAIVTDEAGGEVPAFLDTAGVWRRVTDLAAVS